jgi:glycine dehydrogenase subunit 1
MAKNVHPYIPNSEPATRREMLDFLGIESVDELFDAIPDALRLKEDLPLPAPFLAEHDLRQHVESILGKNKTCVEYLNFKGGGCWQHYVPAVCDEILSRGEFLTSYTGSRHANLGSFQAQYEYQGMMAELVEMDVVTYATYDWGSAAATALGMARRIKGRNKILVAGTICPQRRTQIETMVGARSEVLKLGYTASTGELDLARLEKVLDTDVAAVYIEVPNYLGSLDSQVSVIADLVHKQGALLVVGVDPISLGVIAPPSSYGADIVCGSIQPLGIHMFAGGGLAGFLAMPDDEAWKSQCPWPMLGLLTTEREGEVTFGWVNFDTTPYELRERSEDFIGTGQTIWAIVAGVYLALMGPGGMREIGETIMKRSRYAAGRLNEIEGVRAPVFEATHFKEFVVSFNESGRSVADINSELAAHGIWGGIDLAEHFPELGSAALYCVTEVHSQDDLDRLADTVALVI